MNQKDYEDKLSEVCYWSKDVETNTVIQIDSLNKKKQCSDCGKYVDRLVTVDYRKPLIRRIKCTNCKMYKNPITKEFNIPTVNINQITELYEKIKLGTKTNSIYNILFEDNDK